MHLLINNPIADALDANGGTYHPPEESGGCLNILSNFSIYAHRNPDAGDTELVVPGSTPRFTGWHVQKGTKLAYYLRRSGYNSRKYERLYAIARRIGARAARHFLASGSTLLKINTRRGFWFSTAGVENCFDSEMQAGFYRALPREMRYSNDDRPLSCHSRDRFYLRRRKSDLAVYIIIRDNARPYEHNDAVDALVKASVANDRRIAALLPPNTREDIAW